MFLRKQRLALENLYYQTKFGKEFNLEDYKIKTNQFSGKPLNIIYLTFYDSTFSINNTVLPLQEFGTLFKFQISETPNSKDWYLQKHNKNIEMLEFTKDRVSKHNIDVIVCYLSGLSTSPATLQEIRSLGIPMINESYDDERKFRSRKGKDGIYRGNADICKYFDLSLTTSKSAIVKYYVEGGKAMYKGYGGNENIYKNFDLEKIYDIAFIGADYGIRREYIEYLRKNNIKVYTKGSGWDEGFAEPNEMIEVFNQARIVLGFATVGDNDDIFILKGRDFEVPLTGSFYLTGHHDELSEYFEIGTDIETYSSKEDLLEKVIYYLNNPDKREAIAKSGYQKCLKNYTAKKSYEKVFGYLGL